MYGKGQLTNALITKAKSTVAVYYSIPGDLTPEDISIRVRWLLTKGVFRYGGINLTVEMFLWISLKNNANFLFKAKTYNLQAPFASPLVIDLIRSQWFEGACSDRTAFSEMVSQRKIPAETLILCFTCVSRTSFQVFYF